MSLRPALLCLATALCAGCRPDPLDETGKRCAEARPCGAGFACVSGFCARPGGTTTAPGNLLFNGGFEEGDPPLGWTLTGGEGLTVERNGPHGGLQAAKVLSRPNKDAFLEPSSVPVATPEKGATYCASAWVTGRNHTAELQLRDEAADADAGTALVALDSRWTRLAVSLRPTRDRLTVRLRVDTDEALLDDAWLWRSVDGGCAEEPR